MQTFTLHRVRSDGNCTNREHCCSQHSGNVTGGGFMTRWQVVETWTETRKTEWQPCYSPVFLMGDHCRYWHPSYYFIRLLTKGRQISHTPYVVTSTWKFPSISHQGGKLLQLLSFSRRRHLGSCIPTHPKGSLDMQSYLHGTNARITRRISIKLGIEMCTNSCRDILKHPWTKLLCSRSHYGQLLIFTQDIIPESMSPPTPRSSSGLKRITDLLIMWRVCSKH
jgi:hypothetical protein